MVFPPLRQISRHRRPRRTRRSCGLDGDASWPSQWPCHGARRWLAGGADAGADGGLRLPGGVIWDFGCAAACSFGEDERSCAEEVCSSDS